MTQVELKEVFNGHIRKPLDLMDNNEWQQYFQIMQNLNKPCKEKKLTRKIIRKVIMGMYWELSNGDGNGNDTLDSRYCSYINDVIRAVKTEKLIDYCYYPYQVKDLLRFIPNLQTKLVNQDGMTYIKVWQN